MQDNRVRCDSNFGVISPVSIYIWPIYGSYEQHIYGILIAIVLKFRSNIIVGRWYWFRVYRSMAIDWYWTRCFYIVHKNCMRLMRWRGQLATIWPKCGEIKCQSATIEIQIKDILFCTLSKAEYIRNSNLTWKSWWSTFQSSRQFALIRTVTLKSK